MSKATPARTRQLVIGVLEGERASKIERGLGRVTADSTDAVSVTATGLQVAIRRRINPEYLGTPPEPMPTDSQVRSALKWLTERGEIHRIRKRWGGSKGAEWCSLAEAEIAQEAEQAEQAELRAQADAEVLEENGGSLEPLRDRLEQTLAQLTLHGRALTSPTELNWLVEGLENQLPREKVENPG